MSDDPIDMLRDKIDAAKTSQSAYTHHAQSLNGTDQTEKNLSSGLRAGTELIGGIVGGILFGACADWMFGVAPFGSVIGAVIGVTAGFYGVYRATR